MNTLYCGFMGILLEPRLSNRVWQPSNIASRRTRASEPNSSSDGDSEREERVRTGEELGNQLGRVSRRPMGLKPLGRRRSEQWLLDSLTALTRRSSCSQKKTNKMKLIGTESGGIYTHRYE